jgi:pSer/pThr/pTyr-binding forkhead associated (FHA) protein
LAPPGIFLGRETDNDLQLPVDGVSRYHAKLTEENGLWRVVDLDSSNGIKVNGERVSTRILTDGDLVHLGKVILRFLADPAPEMSAEAAVAAAPSGGSVAAKKPSTSAVAVADEPSRRRFRERDKEIRRLIQLAVADKRRRLRRIAILVAVLLNLLILAGFILFKVIVK